MPDDPRSTMQAAPAADDVARATDGTRLGPATFAQLVAQHQDRVTALVWRLLDWRREDVQDVVQDVFLAAFKNLAKFRGQARPATWLYRIAVNQCRRHRRMRFLRLRLWNPTEALQARSGSSTADAETRARVRRSIADLPLHDREVIVLRYLEGLTTPEIAVIVGRSPNAVDVRLNRARAALRAALGPLVQE